jgi:hypothetical protein
MAQKGHKKSTKLAQINSFRFHYLLISVPILCLFCAYFVPAHEFIPTTIV